MTLRETTYNRIMPLYEVIKHPVMKEILLALYVKECHRLAIMPDVSWYASSYNDFQSAGEAIANMSPKEGRVMRRRFRFIKRKLRADSTMQVTNIMLRNLLPQVHEAYNNRSTPVTE